MENPEIIHSVSLQDTYLDEEGNERQTKIQVDKKEESRIIAYVQALTQVLLNLATSDFSTQQYLTQDTAMKFVAATFNTLNEYIVNSTWKI